MRACSTEMAAHGGATTLALRKSLAAKAFARTAAYDAAIANWFAAVEGEHNPATLVIAGQLAEALRYGENPHQWAAFYRTGEQALRRRHRHAAQGKELSYNNLNDTDAAYELVAEFDPQASAAVAIIKHANPCGVALGATSPRPTPRRSPAIRQRLRRHRRARTARSTPRPRARSSRSSPR